MSEEKDTTDDVMEQWKEIDEEKLEKKEKLYTVNYFNPIGNCECVEHVKATCPLGAAFIAHASNWTPQREFDFDDYNVTEFYPDYFRTLEDVKWTELEAATALKKAMETYVLDQWRWCYKKTNDVDELTADCNDKFEIKKEEVEKILREAGVL